MEINLINQVVVVVFVVSFWASSFPSSSNKKESEGVFGIFKKERQGPGGTRSADACPDWLLLDVIIQRGRAPAPVGRRKMTQKKYIVGGE